jgi:hypothetical protein
VRTCFDVDDRKTSALPKIEHMPSSLYAEIFTEGIVFKTDVYDL